MTRYGTFDRFVDWFFHRGPPPEHRPTPNAHGLIQTARGLCTDEAPYREIDALLGRAVDVVKDLEDEEQRLCATLTRIREALGGS